MSEARDQIINRIRASNGRTGPIDAEAAAKIQERLNRPPVNLIPERGKGEGAELVERFVEMAREASATVTRVASADEVPAAVEQFLMRENLPSEVVMAPDESLDALPWSDQPRLTVRRDRAQPSDYVSVTPAFAGIAETGTLMVHSGATTPYTLNFLPETHIAVLGAEKIVGAYEDAWARLRTKLKAAGETTLPRTVCLITGPSRTGDIEKKILLGMHGPLRLNIILVATDPKNC